MSLLVRYTLKSADGKADQIDAMNALVAGLQAEGVVGVHYSCFSTEDPTDFVGLLEFDDDTGKWRRTADGTFEVSVDKDGKTTPHAIASHALRIVKVLFEVPQVLWALVTVV